MSPIEPPQAYIPPDNIVPRGDELLHPRRPAMPCEPTRLKSCRYSHGALFDLVITNKVCPSEEIDERRLQSFVELVSNNILLSRSPGRIFNLRLRERLASAPSLASPLRWCENALVSFKGSLSSQACVPYPLSMSKYHLLLLHRCYRAWLGCGMIVQLQHDDVEMVVPFGSISKGITTSLQRDIWTLGHFHLYLSVKP